LEERAACGFQNFSLDGAIASAFAAWWQVVLGFGFDRVIERQAEEAECHEAA
jgi:hypothetical protein